jgi:serine phosphatase RsbU (regulator of sigma subunit)
MLEFQVAVTKTHKYASRESGDTVELVERPHGGISIFLVDAQGSGQAAKTISNLVISRGAVMIKEGARDGAVARSLHDYLFTLRHGRVSATLNILSVDLQSRSVVLSRNDENPAYLFNKEGIELHDEKALPIGIYTRTKPAIIERPITPFMGIVMTSDGVVHAGKRKSMPFDVQGFLEQQLAKGWPNAQTLADAVFDRALDLEDGRPRDDVTVVTLTVVPGVETEAPIRRLLAWLPVE